MVLTTDLMLAGEDLETEARFFSETSEALGTTAESARSTPRTPRISLVFVEVVGRSPSQTNSAAAAGAGDALKSDSLTAWSELQRLQDVYSEGGAFLLVSRVMLASWQGLKRCCRGCCCRGHHS